MLRQLLTILFIVTAAVPAQAEIALCPALEQPELYKIKGNEDFSRLVVGKDGWLFRSKTDLKQKFFLDTQTKESLKKLSATLKAKGITLVMVPVPTRGITDGWNADSSFDSVAAKKSYEKFLDDISKTGILVPSLKDLPDNFFWKDDYHWNAKGAEFMAERVAKLLSDKNLLEYVAPVDFETLTTQGSGQKKHVYLDFYNKNCPVGATNGDDYPIYETAEKAVSEKDLFSDKKPPLIILTGTSNSTNPAPSYANFEGFLKQKLSRDIMNVSVAGGGYDGAISQYFLSDDYKNNRPKIIIWEVNASNNFNKPDFYKAVTASVKGECENPIAKSKGSLSDKTVVFQDLNRKDIYPGSYVSLNFENKDIRSAKLRFKYEQGITEVIQITRPARSFPDHSGAFFAGIENKNVRLNSIVVEAGGATGSYTASLCQGDRIDTPTLKKTTSFKMPKFFQYSIHTTLSVADTESDTSIPDLTIDDIKKAIPATDPGIFASENHRWKDFLKFEDVEGQAVPAVLESGVFTIDDLIKKNIISQTLSSFVLRAPIVVGPEASLVLTDLKKPLYLSQDRGVYIASYGQLIIIDAEIAGWNESNGKLAVLDEWKRNFRPFIFSGIGSRFLSGNAVFKNLGYNYKNSYGITFTDSSSLSDMLQTDFGLLSEPTGLILNNKFSGMYNSIYSKGGNKLIVLHNDIHHAEKNGIEIQETKNSIISNNHVQNSRGQGIIIGEGSKDNKIFSNISDFNFLGGILISSGKNIYIGNVSNNNNQFGIRIKTDDVVKINGGEIKSNKNYAFTTDDNARVEVTSIDIEANGGFLKANNLKSLLIKDVDLTRASLTPNFLGGDIQSKNKDFKRAIYAPDKTDVLIKARY